MIFEDPEGATPLEPHEKQGLTFGHITRRCNVDVPRAVARNSSSSQSV